MTLRITDPKHLELVSPHVKAQLEQHLDVIGEPTGRTERPEEAAGAALIKWVDMLWIPAPWLPSYELGLLPAVLENELFQDDIPQMICVGDYFAHNANGGARTAIEGAILKGQGVRKGWPDYTLYMPRGPYHGAVLELKAPNGAKPDAEQLEILVRLEQLRYRPYVSWGFDDARKSILEYLDLD